MTRGFTWCGEWRQVAENADSPLEFSMFINHGTHIFDGASGRMSGSAPNASKSVARGSRQGGIGRYFGHPQPRCCDAGWVSDSPPADAAKHLQMVYALSNHAREPGALHRRLLDEGKAHQLVGGRGVCSAPARRRSTPRLSSAPGPDPGRRFPVRTSKITSSTYYNVRAA